MAARLAGRQRERQEWRSSRFKHKCNGLQWSLASGHLGEPFLALSVAATPLESIAPRAKSTPPKEGPSGGADSGDQGSAVRSDRAAIACPSLASRARNVRSSRPQPAAGEGGRSASRGATRAHLSPRWVQDPPLPVWACCVATSPIRTFTMGASPCVVGVDGGGTKTQAVCLDASTGANRNCKAGVVLLRAAGAVRLRARCRAVHVDAICRRVAARSGGSSWIA